MEYKITWSNEAYIDLDEIRVYLEEFSLQTAHRILRRIMTQASRLASFPYRCPLVGDDLLKRRLVVDDYSVFYVVFEDSKTVLIFRVWHHSKDIGRLV